MPWFNPPGVFDDGSAVLTNGDKTLTASESGSSYVVNAKGTMSHLRGDGGKFYFEVFIVLMTGVGDGDPRKIGVQEIGTSNFEDTSFLAAIDGDLLGIALDLDNNSIDIYHNGVLINSNPLDFDNPTDEYVPFLQVGSGASGTGSDFIGIGRFVGEDIIGPPPEGFSAWEGGEVAEFQGFWTSKIGSTEFAS